MTVEQVLWGGLTLLFALLLFALKVWVSNIRTLIERVDLKVDSKINSAQCLERYNLVKTDCQNLHKHKHASTGEVIIP